MDENAELSEAFREANRRGGREGELLSSMVARLDSRGSRTLAISYEATWPLSLLVDETSIAGYNSVFGAVTKALNAQHHLQKGEILVPFLPTRGIADPVHFFSSIKLTPPSPLRPSLHANEVWRKGRGLRPAAVRVVWCDQKVDFLRRDFAHFANAYRQYLFDQVEGANWRECRAKLEGRGRRPSRGSGPLTRPSSASVPRAASWRRRALRAAFGWRWSSAGSAGDGGGRGRCGGGSGRRVVEEARDASPGLRRGQVPPPDRTGVQATAGPRRGVPPGRTRQPSPGQNAFYDA